MQTIEGRGRSILPMLLAVVLGSGCDSFLDVNENPNSPEHARVDFRLPALIGMFGHSVLFGSTALWGSEWMQQFSYNRETRAYSEIHRYELSAVDAQGPWNFAFATVMNEANNIMNETADAEEWVAYNAIAKFILAWSYSFVTDMWGPVPFREAFDPRNPDPVYDDQQMVYEAVHALIEEAITDLQRPATRVPGSNDLLFGGDLTRWLRLAYTVQARLHLRLAYAPGENPQDRAQRALTALQGGLTSNADDADFEYLGGQGARNPLWTFEDLVQLVASDHTVSLLAQLNDPRLPIVATPVPLALPEIVYRGHRNGGAEETDSTHSRIGPYFSAEDASLTWVSFADAKFIEAEARLIVDGAAAADAPYRAGMRANMEKMGVEAAQIDAYLAARPALSSAANPLEELITQKYIVNLFNIEAWNDWRRTGYPRLEIVEAAGLPGIPQRIRTPGSELSNNATNVAATGIPTGLEGMSVKVWWASQDPD